jgi:folate-binding protein YgfZ
MRALDALRDSPVDLPVVFEAATRARVRVVGPDARAFLHRLSTNHVSELVAGRGCLNVLTTDKGRVVDLVHHLDRGDEGVLLVGSPGKGPAIHAWLDRYLFSEKVELFDVSEGPCVEVTGPTDLPPWGFAGDTLRTFDRVDADGRRVPCVIVIGRAVEGVRATADEAEVARIAAGVPGAGELVDKFNPLDLGLHDAIHWNKGCYIGQEVIARLDTYQKQHKVLATLRVAGAVPGATVNVDGAVAGEVTSVAPFTWGERPNALCVARVMDHAQVNGADAVVGVPATAQAKHD